MTIVFFNKPYDVLCQFTNQQGRKTLADYISIPKVYAAGRLDRDSEGLLILTDDGKLQHKIANPTKKMAKTYLVQIEGVPLDIDLQPLRQGIQLKDGKTRPAIVQKKAEPDNLWLRDPPVRFRKNKPTSWLSITIREGKNRQVRRMTAAIGFPTLRLIRTQIGNWSLDSLQPGEWRVE